MNKVVLILLLLGSITARAQTPTGAEQRIQSYMDGISYWRFEYSSDDTTFANEVSSGDSLAFYNNALKAYLVNEAGAEPLLLKANMKSLEGSDISIVTSDDKKLRIYSWNTHTGGTMNFFENVIIYSAGGSTKAVEASAFYKQQEGNAEGEAREIYKVPSESDKIYLAIYSAKLATNYVAKYITAYSIVNGELKEADVFSSNKEITSSMMYDYDYLSNYDFEKMKEVNTIKLAKGNKKLYIPLVQDGQMTGMWQLYIWDGSKFVYSKDVK